MCTQGDHTVTISVDEGDYGYINLDELHVNSFSTPSVQLFDAALAANGASHIEMGQGDRMIAAAYFPDRTKWMDEELTQWITRYYDVTTGYEELFYGPTLRPLDDSIVEIPGYNVSRNGLKNTIYARVMRSGGMDVIHLINLLGNDEFWRDPGNAVSTGSFTVRYHCVVSPTPAHSTRSPRIPSAGREPSPCPRGSAPTRRATTSISTSTTSTPGTCSTWDRTRSATATS